jgi:hypothetical protein
MMRIWKLTPVDPSDPTWIGYDTRPMFVRVESAREAQERAEQDTVQYVSSTSGQVE